MPKFRSFPTTRMNVNPRAQEICAKELLFNKITSSPIMRGFATLETARMITAPVPCSEKKTSYSSEKDMI